MLQSFRTLLHKLIEIERTGAHGVHCGAASWLEIATIPTKFRIAHH